MFGFGISMLGIALPGLPPATSHAYTIVYESDDAAGAGIVRETMTVAASRNGTYVVLSNANGAMASFPAKLASDGEIENEPAEPALVCYNTAVSLLAERATRPLGPLELTLTMGGRLLPVPLQLVRAASSTSRTVAEGRAGPAIVEARIDAYGDVLADATLVELSVAGSPERAVSRTTCSIATAGAPETSSDVVGS